MTPALRAARFGDVLTAVVLGLALWLSGAVFAPLTADAGSGWLAALPPWPALAAAVIAAAMLVLWRPPATRWALLPLAGVLLPWMPGLQAGLIYAGPLVILIWAAVLALAWGPSLAPAVARCGCASSANRATIAAFLIAAASTSLAAWRVAPMIPGGDEPHYLIITQSLMQDGDLRIENNHAQRDYAAYARGELHPQYLTRGKDGAIYPVHAPGLPALVIPAFALGGHPAVVAFLVIVMALASALVWRLAWLATGEIGAAWFGWAAVAASVTWTFQSFLVFPDAMGGAALACGLWLVLRLDRGEMPARWHIAATGAAVAALPWLHTRFAVLAAGLGLMIVLRLFTHDRRAIVAFLIPPIIAAAAWFGMFQVIYGTPSPIAQWGSTGESRMGYIPSGLAGLLFDQQFGFLPYAPVLAAGLAGLALRHAAGWRLATRAQLAVLIVAAYVAASASYVMWWGGLSVPARLFTVLLPLLAPGAAAVWARTRSAPLRAALSAALAWTIFATTTLAFAGRGITAWNDRRGKSGLWFEWVTPLFDWSAALPAFFRADDTLGREALPLPAFYIVVLIWTIAIAAAIAGAAIVSRVVTRGEKTTSRARLTASAITIAAIILALPAATVLALRAQGANGAAPARAQMALLTRLAEGHVTLFDAGARRFVTAAGALPMVRVTMPEVRGTRERRLSPVPAGAFRVSGAPAGAPGAVTIGRASEPVAVLGDGPVDVRLPVAVNALSVRGAEGRAIVLEPLPDGPPARSRQRALRALRYGLVTAYFIDDRAYAEGGAFWVGGARYANVILQADPGVTQALVEITNAPVPNRVIVVGAAEPFDRALAPRETVILPVTFDAHGTARLQIESTSGFIPAQAEPGNGDQRFLGVYVKVK